MTYKTGEWGEQAKARYQKRKREGYWNGRKGRKRKGTWKPVKERMSKEAYDRRIKYGRDLQRRKRSEVLKRLGNKCSKCGIDDFRVLQVDHVDGGGTEERTRLKKNSHALYKEVMKGKTGKYQLLCSNCNWIKRYENDENRKVVR